MYPVAKPLVVFAACVSALFLLLLISACENFYGEPRNKSQFISAELMQDDIVLFSYAHTVYRMARGIAAFPDGGKARFDTDTNILGTYNPVSHEIRIIKREKNLEWQPDAGHYHILQSMGTVALLSQGGQRAGSYDLDNRYWLIDIDDGTLKELNLASDLNTRGRAIGYIYMVNRDGTLLFISPSIEEKKRKPHWHREADIVPELWVRYPDGDYHKITASRHYEGISDDAIIYWIPQTRKFMSFDLSTKAISERPDYKYPPYQEVSKGVSITENGRRLSLGTKHDGQWFYDMLDLDPAALEQ